jgi:mono/diheme cytochrome c family protein
MTTHEPRMKTHLSMTTRRSGAVALIGGAALAMTLSVTATPAAQAPDSPAKPAAAGPVDAKAVYEARCQVCHMADGNSQLMPNMSFADGIWKHGSTLKEVQATITDGVPSTAMVAFKEQLTPAEITALAKFVRKFDKKLK